MATTKKFRVKHGLDAGNNTISFVNDPVSANDAATKNYVDVQVASAPGDVSNSYLTSTFTTNTAFQSYVANTNSRIDTLEAGGTLVTNSYLTSTYTTNTVFQSALANTNAYIATKTDDTTALATNTALRVLIDDRLQVVNADAKYATWSSLTSTNTAIRSYVDTEVAALVNSAPVTLNTLNELADALGDDPNFATTLTTNLGQKLGATASVTLTGDVTGSGSFSSNAVSIALTDTNLGNTNLAIADRMQVANVISYTAKYLEVANVAAAVANTSTSNATYAVANSTLTFTRADSSTFDVVVDSASVEVSNTAPSSPNEGDMWWDSATGELYIYYGTSWVEAVAQDVSPYANNGTFSSSNNTITFTRTDGSQFDVVLTGVGEVTNAYVTSTYTTNTAFQSALANTNAYIASVDSTRASDLANTNVYIATKTDDTTVLATNTALRALISDRMQVANTTLLVNDRIQVANADAKYATWTSLTSTNTAIRSYVDTEIAALVNSAPTTLDTLDELANALGDDANFSTTVLTLIGTKASNATLTSTYVTNTVFQSALANTNAYVATKANTSMLSAYLEVANVTSSIPVSIQNTAPTITANGELWWDNAAGELYVAYANNWVEAVAQDVTPYANNGTFSSSNNTITFVRTDGSQFDVVLTGVGEVTNAYVTSTYTTNTVFQSALANTNAYIATKTDDTTVLATNTALRTLINDRMQVANVQSYVATEIAALVNSAPTTLDTLDELANALGDDANFSTTVLTLIGTKASNSALTSTYVTNTVFQSALANTNAYIATKTDDTTVLATNTALRTLISDRIQVANLNTTLADYWPSANVITYTAKYLEVANSSSGTSLTVSNTAPTITANGELWWDNSVGELYVSYSNNWVEAVAQDITPYTNNVSYSTSNTTLTFTRTDASQFDVYLDLSGVSGEVSNSYLTSTFVTNTTFQSALANTNSYIATKTDDTVALATNTALRTLISDRIQVANVTGTYVTNTVFQSALANTNSYIATKTDDTTVLATNTALRTLISDRIQVANADSKYATWSSLTSTNTAIRAYVDTEVAALVNSAPTTLDTLDELAAALGDDANFSTTVLTLIGSKASNSAVTSTYVTNTVFQSALANTNTYIATKADSSSLTQYLQVANVASNTSTTSASLSGNTATFTRADSSTFTLDLSSIASAGGGASVTVANTAPVSPTEGDLYFDNELATMFIYYDSSWVEVQPTIDPINPLTYGVDTFTANGTATDFTHTSDTVSADAMLVTVDGIIQRPTTDYTVSSKTVTFGSAPANTSIVAIRVTTGAFTGVSNTTFQSALANTNAYIASVAPSYQEVTSNTTMVAGTKYIVGTRTANVVLTFPTSASLGDEIRILDGTGQANAYGIELNRNGHRIQGELANVVIDTSRAAGGYVYYNANNGWILTEV